MRWWCRAGAWCAPTWAVLPGLERRAAPALVPQGVHSFRAGLAGPQLALARQCGCDAAAPARSRARWTSCGKRTHGDLCAAFRGLDAGWTALTAAAAARFTTIYTDQADKVVDAWIHAGRSRFGTGRLFGRADGVAHRGGAARGEPLYLLPDMNFGPEESIFVPFYGVPARPPCPRCRALPGWGAPVVPVVTRMTRTGYEVQVMPAWDDFPGDDMAADTARMNLRAARLDRRHARQYYWVHKRFKTRPAGRAVGVY
jgi:hypothetical protein